MHDTISRTVSLAPPNYRTESLRVAPEFGREPDSALAARLEREAARAAEVARLAHDTPRLWRGEFAMPRPGRVTSGFGTARQFNGELRSRHMGTDFAGATGAPIRAVNRGVVRLVDRFYLGGNIVYVDHGAGLVTAYLHMSRTGVAVGDTVQKGQIIGRVGSTGRVTGPHLHFIARYGQITVDPMTLLPKPAATPATKGAAAKRATTRAAAKRSPPKRPAPRTTGAPGTPPR
jgi:murein DD-endopeptidase MepM/ murein hydrolase activator NlpD